MKKKLKIGIAIILVISIGAIVYYCINGKSPLQPIEEIFTKKIDDWEYSGMKSEMELMPATTLDGGFKAVDTSVMKMESTSEANIGFSTGGAKDINNFRENIKNGYFPISTDITYNGLFYDYSFDTGRKNESEELFSPAYSCAISKDPVSEKEEYYMAVGLNSNIKESDFSRKKLNLVVVLDISGSMSSSFNSYYYDSMTEKNIEDDNKSKMQIANESVNILIDQLNDDDSFGMVLFDNEAYLAKPINAIRSTDVGAIKDHVLEITAKGGTNFEAGYTLGTKLFDEYKNIDSDEYENRIIVITDAMPNYGTTSKNGLMKYVEENAEDGIYTTFIGVGVDFNTELIEKISDVRGANYYSVHNSKEFKERMGEQFEYMVTPLVFDLSLDLNSEDYEIAGVYGSDTVNSNSGNIMNVNTLFPSKTNSEGEVKGGIILLKLKKLNKEDKGEIELKVSYKDRNGKKYENSQKVEFNGTEEKYDNAGIRKAIVLTRYANVLKNWILYERSDNRNFIIYDEKGIQDCEIKPDEVYKLLGENERTSVKLTVSEEYKVVFEDLKEYIESENKEIKDEDLNQEIEILEELLK